MWRFKAKWKSGHVRMVKHVHELEYLEKPEILPFIKFIRSVIANFVINSVVSS